MTWNANGTLKNFGITDSFNAADNNLSCLFGYDDLARLISSNCSPTWTQTFSYDVFGNLSKSGNVNYNPGYSSNNRALTSTYDTAGDTLNDGSTAYTYDSERRPQTVGSTQIVYDAFNRAVEYNNGSTHTQVVYDPQGAKLAYMSGQTLQKYMLPLAGGVQAVFNSSGLWYYRHADWLGSSRLALDTNGNMYSARAFAPFGETYAEAGANDRSFTGQTQDLVAGTTGIYDFMFRQHSAAQGRWLVPDPAGIAAVDPTNPQSWNRYAYVVNDPLSNIDPQGLDCVYLNDSGNGVDSIDHNSNPTECSGLDANGNPNGGYWIPGTVSNASWVTSIDSENNQIGAYSDLGRGAYGWTASTNELGGGWGTVNVTATLPNGDIPIYGLMGHGADILAAAGQQASHDLGCAGMGWAVQSGSVAASGAVLPTGAKLGGATSGTSVASATARTLAVDVGRTPTPVGIPFTGGFAWKYSSTLGGVLGRWAPYIGTAVSALLFNHCVDQHP